MRIRIETEDGPHKALTFSRHREFVPPPVWDPSERNLRFHRLPKISRSSTFGGPDAHVGTYLTWGYWILGWWRPVKVGKD